MILEHQALLAAILSGSVVLSSVSLSASESGSGQTLWVYIGTYTRTQSKGIYLLRLDLSSGKVTGPELVAEVGNPPFLAIHPSRPLMYSIGEIPDGAGKKVGAVNSYSIEPGTGKLTLLNQQSSRGLGPCHLTVDATGQCVLVANYSGGNIACLPIQADGRLAEASAFIQHEGSSVNPKRQQAPHAHSINVSPDNRFAFVADLGLDKVMIYRLDPAKGSLTPNDPPFVKLPPGAGPRHFAFHPNGRWAYVINEIDSTLSAMSYDAQRGALTVLQTVTTLPVGFDGNNTTAEVQVHPSGRFVFGSNRGHDSIATFAVDQTNGTLRCVGHASTRGKTPRNFGVDPTGAFLFAANQDSGNVVVLRIDQQSGQLQQSFQEFEIPMPVCVKFLRPL